jgi:hypothetical protein
MDGICPRRSDLFRFGGLVLINDRPDLESEIRSLKSRPKLAAADKTRLESLESELDYVNKVKEKYVADHPEARDRVFRTHGDKSRRLPGHEDEDDEGAGGGGDKRLYDESGRLRDPTRSVYYDAVYNPFGVPPPGMPYKERSEWFGLAMRRLGSTTCGAGEIGRRSEWRG